MRIRRLSWTIAFALLCAATSMTAAAQASEPVDDISRFYQLDFGIPDAPAFDLLQVDPGTILRPSSVRDLTAATAGFLGPGRSISLPRSFALELSPALLINGRTLTLQQYRDNAWLYRLRLSGATSREAGVAATTDVAFGVRLSVVDDADLRTNATYSNLLRNTITAGAGQVVRDKTAVEDALLATASQSGVPMDPERATSIADQLVAAKDSVDDWQRILASAGFGARATNAFLELAFLPARVEEIASTRTEIQQQISAIEGRLWNAQALDLAFAVRATSADSTGRSLFLDRLSGWATYANGFGHWGQILFGTQVGATRDSTRQYDVFGSGSMRLYAGGNATKGFFELQGTFRDGATPRYLLNSGAECRASSGWWVTPTAGLVYDPDRSKWDLKTSLSVKLGLSPGARE